MSNTRVILVDDCRINREGLAALLAGQSIEVAYAWDLPSLLQQLEDAPTNLIVLNIGTRDGFTLLQVCLDLSPRTKVIVSGLSADRESEIVFCAEAGVAGLHLRTESFDHLMTLIREAGEGPALCSTEVTAILLRRLYSTTIQNGPDGDPGLLTAREREVLALLERGLSNQQIASQLSVTLHTVKNHVHNVLTKLGAGSRAEAAAAARRMRFNTGGTPEHTLGQSPIRSLISSERPPISLRRRGGPLQTARAEPEVKPDEDGGGGGI